ncbi:MAG TPA: response regulator [Chitinophaga sp.]|uniref:ATP-binding response regulator n=1 Tax=Chitinophaga sp. TaxID=1869181 RepID=UPI002C30C8B8|nr:response regulator [Chitinophaga sp.]HVI44574.1 response regulator [Chitinophaga sp.]
MNLSLPKQGSLLFKLQRIGTFLLDDEDQVKRTMLVNRVSLGISACILLIAPVVLYFTGSGNIFMTVVIEFFINNLVLILNHYRKYKAAALVLFFLQYAAVTYFAFMLGSLLQLHFMVLFLIAIIYLIFREKLLRQICMAGAIVTMILLQISYFYSDIIEVSNTAACVLQSLAITGVMFLILFIAKPTYKHAWDDNKELNETNHFKTMFYSSVVHELRNELLKSEQIVELINREIHLERSIRSINPLIKMMRRATRNASVIINAVLNMASKEAGKSLEKMEVPVNLKHLVNSLIATDQVLAKASKLKFRVNIQENLPKTVKLDVFRFREIIDNLISNALKYSFPDSIITVDVGVIVKQVYIRITNFGDTIPESLLQRIFDPFTNKQKEGKDSTGLGMFICANAVHSMGGSISVTSKNFITCFSVLLPLNECADREVDIPNSNWQIETIPNYKILIADDDRLNLALLERMLQEAGCAVICAASGIEVLATVDKEKPDVIVMDYIMPNMDGIETTRRLKGHPSFSNIPVIVATGMGYAETREQILNAGADGVLTKPYSLEQLRELLHKLIPAPASEG